jgi:hypothetical protein
LDIEHADNPSQMDYVGQKKREALQERNRMFMERLNAQEKALAKAAKKRDWGRLGRRH